MEGVVRTRVGYAGGTAPSPTYHRLGDHTETIQIDFDPTRISYEDLLDEFWSQHDATAPAYSRQYTSAIWTHDAEQERAAVSSRDRFEASVGRPVLTLIQPFDAFHLAEDYHQKYRLRSDAELAREFREIFGGDEAALRESTAAARVNGFLDSACGLADLMGEVDRYGLSERAKMRLVDLVEARSSRLRSLR